MSGLSTVEVISPFECREVQKTETPQGLRSGLGLIVNSGVNDHFNDVVWERFYGSSERMSLLTRPGFDSLVGRLTEVSGTAEDKATPIDEFTRPNVTPSGINLASNMVHMAGPSGGPFYRAELLSKGCYLVAPAYNPYKEELDQAVSEEERGPLYVALRDLQLEANLIHGICFTGGALVAAMFAEDRPYERIDHEDQSTFLAYRQRDIGNFLLDHTVRQPT